MKNIRLGVNIDHVATVRNARGENYPDPLKAAVVAQQSGADSITIHLREDRRHIRDKDLKLIKKKLTIPLNLEIAPTKEMFNIAIRHKPNFICLVPEKRKEITTEGGLNLNYKKKLVKNFIRKLKNKNIRVSLFIEPSIKDVYLSKYINADCVEFHTGKICNLINKNKPYHNSFLQLKRSVILANKLGLEVHAGHGMTFKSAKIISNIKNIKEFNIGHFIIGESIFFGLKRVINKFKIILKK